ncbi:MAG: hypothetical protein V1648_04745 [Candidatus Aenigmatarchaeota archaeon]
MDRRKFVLGIPFGAALLHGTLHSQEKRRDPFVPTLSTPVEEVEAVEYFRKNYGENAERLAKITFSSFRGYADTEFPHDPLLHMALLRQESNFGDRKLYISPAGAMGPAQVMPSTALGHTFGLDVVYNPDYFIKLRKASGEHSGSLSAATNSAFAALDSLYKDPSFKKTLGDFDAYRNAWGFIDESRMPVADRGKYAAAMSEAKKAFFDGAGKKVSDAVFDYLFGKGNREGFDDEREKMYRLYEDELGSMIFKNYANGDARRARASLVNPDIKFEKRLDLKPQKDLESMDQRACDELVIPGSYREMQRLTKKFKGNYLLSVASYNAGDGRVRNGILVPGIRETWNYISHVFHNYFTFTKALRG